MPQIAGNARIRDHRRFLYLPTVVRGGGRVPHSFDIIDDSETLREMIRRVIAHLRAHLLGAG